MRYASVGLVGWCLRLRPHVRRRYVATSSITSGSVEASYTSPPGPSSVDTRLYDVGRVRNFAVVAHVDHGKSTLADRLLQAAGVLADDAPAQFLDRLRVERERGITVKSQLATMLHMDKRTGQAYLLNLIDTPGHSDFSYEVHRALAACQGVLLLVDANKGVESQTVAYFWKCLEIPGLVVVPVINKIDIAPAEKVDYLLKQLDEKFGFKPNDCLQVSAKTGANVKRIFDAIVDQVHGPNGDRQAPIEAQVLDAWHLHYHGAVLLVCLRNGTLCKGSAVQFAQARHQAVVSHVGVMGEGPIATTALYAGQAGYCVCAPQHGLDLPAMAELVGDTMLAAGAVVAETAKASARPQPALFVQLFPTAPQHYDGLNEAVNRLRLNDTSVRVSPATSAAFGRGWRLGFLGLLHMHVFAERLSNEQDAHEFILTRATVPFKAMLRPHVRKRYGGRSEITVEQPDDLPSRVDAQCYLEPFCEVRVTCPSEHTGTVMALCARRRATFLRSDDADAGSDDGACHVFRAPLAELIDDFGDELKSATAGYATFHIDSKEYEYEPVDLVKLSVLVNHERAPGFDVIVPRSVARARGLDMIQKIADRIPMHQFAVPVQAAIGSKIVARVNVAPYRTDFASKLKDNFSDRTRVAKLLKTQREGKARQKAATSVTVPPAAYVDVFRR